MSHELTLIVAATRNMGIGAKGGLPWTGLKKEMAYFARVTKRLPPQVRKGVMSSFFCSMRFMRDDALDNFSKPGLSAAYFCPSPVPRHNLEWNLNALHKHRYMADKTIGH